MPKGELICEGCGQYESECKCGVKKTAMGIKEQVAGIVEQSRPSCGLPKECNTECGKCGADRIHSLYLAWFKEMVERMVVVDTSLYPPPKGE